MVRVKTGIGSVWDVWNEYPIQYFCPGCQCRIGASLDIPDVFSSICESLFVTLYPLIIWIQQFTSRVPHCCWTISVFTFTRPIFTMAFSYLSTSIINKTSAEITIIGIAKKSHVGPVIEYSPNQETLSLATTHVRQAYIVSIQRWHQNTPMFCSMALTEHANIDSSWDFLGAGCFVHLCTLEPALVIHGPW